MASDNCVKCGCYIGFWTSAARTDRNAPPCCNACRQQVIEEAKQHLAMWPNNWHGGWMWTRDLWQSVPVPSDAPISTPGADLSRRDGEAEA